MSSISHPSSIPQAPPLQPGTVGIAPQPHRTEYRTVPTGAGPAIAYSLTEPLVAGDTRSLTLLLLTGAWHTKDCYERRFTTLLAERGWRVAAMNYRGHGVDTTRSGGDYREATLTDYADDVRTVVNDLCARGLVSRADQFVLVPHSMGGPVAATYLSRWPATGVIYFATGIGGNLVRHYWHLIGQLARCQPFATAAMLPRLFAGDPDALIASKKRLRWLFLDWDPLELLDPPQRAELRREIDAAMAFYAAHPQGESRRIMRELQRAGAMPPVCQARHIAFLGATQDRMVPPAVVTASARLYQAAGVHPAVQWVEAPHCAMLAGDIPAAVAAIDRLASDWQGMLA